MSVTVHALYYYAKCIYIGISMEGQDFVHLNI